MCNLILGLAALHGATFSCAAPLTTRDSPGNSTDPCADLTNKVAAAPPPNGTNTPTLDIQLAYDCLRSVPIRNDLAVKQVQTIKKYVEFHSTLAYLAQPPADYGQPPADILGALNNISDSAAAGAYSNEYDFEMDISNVVLSAHDQHFYINQVMPLLIIWRRAPELISLSEDGVSLPKIYVFDDMPTLQSPSLNDTWTPSAVLTINGQDIVAFLKADAQDFNDFHDIDTAYNSLFNGLASVLTRAYDRFRWPARYPGQACNLTFENGSSNSLTNFAKLGANVNMSTLRSGGAIFSDLILPSPTNSSVPISVPSSSATASVPLGYPRPIVQHSQNYILGFHLSDPAFSDLAVLSVLSFDDFSNETMTVITKFLQMSQAANKTKLIIDLQRNDGGRVKEAYDLFKQLFPQLWPYDGNRRRAPTAVNLLGSAVSQNVTSFSQAPDLYYSWFNYRYRNEDNANFSSWEDVYGPYQAEGDNFTAIERWPLDDPDFAEYLEIDPEILSPSLLRAAPFAAENIVMLSDGVCGSTCAVFSEFMRSSANVSTVAVGGLPIYGPMQVNGGTKGSEFMSLTNISTFSTDVYQIAGAGHQQTLQTNLPIENFPLNLYPGMEPGAINLRNQVRQGNPSQVPLQFVYGAAECRLFYTADHAINMMTLWEDTYQATWGNGTCVPGSTNHPSALPGKGFREAPRPASNGSVSTTSSSSPSSINSS